MKVNLSVLLIIVFGLNISCAQIEMKIPIPLVRENSKIDRFMDTVLKNKVKYDRNKTGFFEKSYWRLEVFKESYPMFQIFENNGTVINYVINKIVGNPVNYGCFSYRGCMVFVWTGGDFHDFFSSTSEVKTFNFIYKLNGTEAIPSPQLVNNGQQLYKYLNGQFSDPGPPVVTVK